MGGMLSWVMSLLGKAPTDLAACSAIFTDGMSVFNFITHHLSLTQIGANMLSNILANGLKIAGDGVNFGTSFLAHDMYTSGKDLGEILILTVQ